jgi:predicted dehydrogenase
MRFALLGNHRDGVQMADALVATGRHEIVAVTEAEMRGRWTTAQHIADLEEILADPAVDAVIVASKPTERAAVLRRALQSERHVLCVHPADQAPDTAYEAAMIEADTKKVLFPLLPDAHHPGVVRLHELLTQSVGPVGNLELLQIERSSSANVLLDAGLDGYKPSLPDWHVLRLLGGDAAEVSAFAREEEVDAAEPLLVAGRFENAALFEMTLLPNQPETRLRITALGDRGGAELFFPLGAPGPAFLSWRDAAGAHHEESWDIADPWPAVVAQFDRAIAGNAESSVATLSWQEEIRILELDDAVRRSVHRRRSSTLEYPAATEEAGFKGTMTLVGCGLIWVILLLLVLSVWVPWMGWLIGPALAFFLLLQMLRWVIPGPKR